MGRINIENNLFTRGEWFDLIVKTGSPDTALGSLVRVWLVAQRYWFPNKELIPIEIWKRENLNQAVVDSGLAEVRENGIYVRGCENQFQWLFNLSEKGKKGGEASAKIRKRLKSVSKKQQKDPTTVNQQSTTGEAEVNLSEPSLLLTPNSLLISHNSNSLNSAKAQKTKSFIAAYCRSFFEAYGFNPEISKKDSGIAKRIASDLSEDKALVYLKAFFSMPDPWLRKIKHPLSALELKFNEVMVFANTGKFTTQKETTQQDSSNALIRQLKAVDDGNL